MSNELQHETEPLVETCNCGNKDFPTTAMYCKVCGRPVHNVCANQQCMADNDWDARYCETCGEPTVIWLWDLRNEESKSNQFVDDVPF